MGSCGAGPSYFVFSKRIFPRQVGNRLPTDRKYPIGRVVRSFERGQGEHDGAQPAATDRGLFERIGDAAQRVRPGGVARPVLRQRPARWPRAGARSEEHTSELQSLMRITYAVVC